MAVAPSPQLQRAHQVWFAASALVLVALGIPVVADHPQTVTTSSGTFGAQFDHDGDNEWWVEFQARGLEGDSIFIGWARVEGESTWHYMKFQPNDYARQQQGWSKFAPDQSFHIAPGKRVQFKVELQDAATGNTGAVTSCFFTHTAGVEQCGGSTTTTTSSTTTTTGSSGFDATFTGVRGNEWWVQANVATNGPAISKVDVRLNSNGVWGTFMPVTKQSWGWGSSYHIVQGTIVQLRATASDGRTDLSSCRQWIPASGQDAAIVTCPGSGGGTTPFDATFTGVKANEWWIQANVAGNEPISAVYFRVNCAPSWLPLTKQSWGGWAPNYQVHFNQGDKVDFRAKSTDGDNDVSGGYIMRAATPTSGCAFGAWPVEGSHVVYHLDSGVCGGGECFEAAGTLALTYHDGADWGWDGVCVGRNTHTRTDGSQTHEDWRGGAMDMAPLVAKVPTFVGATHDMRQVGVFYSAKSCGVTGVDTRYTVDRQESRPTALVDANHNPIVLSTWVADRDMPEENYLESIWDTKLGLVLETHSYPRRSGQGDANLYVTMTDAPLR